MDIRTQWTQGLRRGGEMILKNVLWLIFCILLVVFATSVCLSPLLLTKP
jgi:hypothetical protein